MHLQAINSRMATSQFVAYGTPWASLPLSLEQLRFGSIQVQAAQAKNSGGARIKVQGSNVGVGLSITTVLTSGRQLDPGGNNPTNLGWVDLNYSVDLPPNLDATGFVPPFPGGGSPTVWDVNWIRLLVVAGPGGITLDAWAKFKNGG